QLYDYYMIPGRFYRPQPLPKGYRRGRIKQCFDNSCKLVMSTKGLAYCEGFVLDPETLLHIEHGWCVTDDGMVIDVTLREPGLSYFGVTYTPVQVASASQLPISHKIVADNLKQTKDTR